MANGLTHSSHTSRRGLALVLQIVSGGIMKRFLPVVIVIAGVVGLSAQTLEVQLQRAVQKETATGDLKAAIEAYKKIASSAGSNHAIAAQALLHEAEAHQKLGDAEAA